MSRKRLKKKEDSVIIEAIKDLVKLGDELEEKNRYLVKENEDLKSENIKLKKENKILYDENIQLRNKLLHFIQLKNDIKYLEEKGVF